MKRLANFVHNHHDTGVFQYPAKSEQATQLCHEMSTMYFNTIDSNLFVPKPYGGKGIGVSQLGRPAIITAYEYFYGCDSLDVSWAKKRLWLKGHVFELWVYYMLRRLGYFAAYQTNVKVSDKIPNGHPDFIVTDSTGEEAPFVLECKHLKSSDYKAMLKKGMTSDRYRTQLSLYCMATGYDGAWIVGNAETGEIQFIPYLKNHQDMDASLKARAFEIVEVLSQCQEFWQTLSIIQPPPPRVTVTKRNSVPPEMYVGSGVFHPAAQLYNIEWVEEKGELKPHITGYNYPAQAKQWEPKL